MATYDYLKSLRKSPIQTAGNVMQAAAMGMANQPYQPPQDNSDNTLKALLLKRMIEQQMPTEEDISQRALRESQTALNLKLGEQMGQGGAGEVIYRRGDTGEEVPQQQALADMAQGNRNFIVSRRNVTKQGVREDVLSKPEDLTKEEKDYVNLSGELNKTLDFIKNTVVPKLEIGSAEKGGFGDWQSLQAQSLPFPLIRDQGVQDFKSAILDLKQRIPFLRGGKQLTSTEAKRVDSLLNPFGQTAESYKNNLEKLRQEFFTGKQVVTGGLNYLQPSPSVSGMQQPQVNQDMFTEENINATAQKYGITPEEVKRRLGVQ